PRGASPRRRHTGRCPRTRRRDASQPNRLPNTRARSRSQAILAAPRRKHACGMIPAQLSREALALETRHAGPPQAVQLFEREFVWFGERERAFSTQTLAQSRRYQRPEAWIDL